MKKALIWFIFVALLYVVQVSFLPLISFHGISADLLLLAVVAYAFNKGKEQGVLFGFLLGLLQDLSSGTFFGLNIFSKMLVGFFCGSFSTRVFKEQALLPILSTLAATAGNYLVSLIIILLLGYRLNFVTHVQYVLIPMLWYNVIFAYPVYGLMSRMLKFMKDKK